MTTTDSTKVYWNCPNCVSINVDPLDTWRPKCVHCNKTFKPNSIKEFQEHKHRPRPN